MPRDHSIWESVTNSRAANPTETEMHHDGFLQSLASNTVFPIDCLCLDYHCHADTAARFFVDHASSSESVTLMTSQERVDVCRASTVACLSRTMEGRAEVSLGDHDGSSCPRHFPTSHLEAKGSKRVCPPTLYPFFNRHTDRVFPLS